MRMVLILLAQSQKTFSHGSHNPHHFRYSVGVVKFFCLCIVVSAADFGRAELTSLAKRVRFAIHRAGWDLCRFCRRLVDA